MDRKKHHEINKHHMIQKCERKHFNISDPRNIVRMNIIQHNALHQLFHNLAHPQEQHEWINGLRRPVQSRIVTELVDELNNLSIDEYYVEGLVR